MQTPGVEKMLIFMEGSFFLMVIRDLWGSSPGRILMGISLRNFEDLNTTPGISTRLKRNLMLLLFPVEGLVLLKDSFAFRLADRWFQTRSLGTSKTNAGRLKAALGKSSVFCFFGAAILLEILTGKNSSLQNS